MNSNLWERLFDWATDINTLLIFAMVVLLLFWSRNGHPDRLLNMADNVLTAIFSLAVGYKLGKAAAPNPPE